MIENYLLLDTNVVLHQLDLLEHAKFLKQSVIILKTVLEEVKHRNANFYSRLRELIANPSAHFFVFDNEFHRFTKSPSILIFRETFCERQGSETPNDRNDRGT